MRPLRFLRPAHSPVAVVHAMSRVIEGRMVFDDRAKAKFRQLLAKQCAFSQAELDTFCLMGADVSSSPGEIHPRLSRNRR